jgi:uncharacterized membrane protein
MSDLPEETTLPASGRQRRKMHTGRLQAFSDSVFAFAVTLLVLDLFVPAVTQHNVLGALGGHWSSFLAYMVSFATVGAIWLGHSLITEYLERTDGPLSRLNLLLLLLVSFLPFPTRLLAQYIGVDSAEKVAATIYGLTLLCTAGLLWVLWRYALHEHLVVPDADDTELSILTQRLTPGLGGYVLLLVLGLIVPVVAVVGYFLLALFYIMPFPFQRRPWQRPGARKGPSIDK